MLAAYADPPYLGQARKHYSDDPKCAEVDFGKLIRKLEDEYHGWALSLSSTSLRQILPLCPDHVRIGAWVKPFCSFKPNVNPAYAWEPVIFKPVRKMSRTQDTVTDWVSEVITLQRGCVGAKPLRFCWWIFEILGLDETDYLDDLFPGSGAVSSAWEHWKNSPRLALA